MHNLTALAWAAAALVLDQVTKIIAVRTMTLHDPIPVLGDIVRLTYIQNPGAAFGLTLGGPLLHTVVAIGALAILGWLYVSLPVGARVQRIALALVLGGAVGNIIDRIRLDYVIDFFDVGLSATLRWPVFNVADSFVTVGVLVLALTWSRHDESDEDASAPEPPESPPAGDR